MLLSNCAVGGKKKQAFIKNQEHDHLNKLEIRLV